METKICSRCGRELPLENFNNKAASEDGKQSYCKDCVKAYNMQSAVAKKAMQEENPLSAFKPRELIEELRKRGYRGKLQYVYEITL